jgi:hypothetical protein
LVVRVLQRVRYVSGNLHRLVDAELLLAIELLPQRFPFYIRHDVKQEPSIAAVCRCRAAAVVQRQNVRVLESRRGLDFLQEPVGAEHGPEFGPQHLQRNLAVVFQILGKIDGGHASFAESTLDAVTVGKGSGEALGDFSHALRRSPCSVTLPSGPGLLIG